MKLKRQNLYYKILEINEEENTIKAIFSTSDQDRHGEIVSQDGWDLTKFKKNPVILFGHDHSKPPVGKAIAFGFEMVDGKKALVGLIKFAVEEYDFAKTIYNLYKGEYMRAFSVGFLNKESSVLDDGTVVLEVNELYEVSAVPVPANPEAITVAKGAGVDVKPYFNRLEELEARKELMFTQELESSIMGALKEIKTVAKTITDLKAVDNMPISTEGKTSTPKAKGYDEAKRKRKAIRHINRAIGKLRSSKRNLL